MQQTARLFDYLVGAHEEHFGDSDRQSPVPLAGDIEDTATNSVDAASRLRRIVEDLYGIVAIELMHAAQACHAVGLNRNAQK